MLSAKYLAGYYDGEGFLTMSMRKDGYMMAHVGVVTSDLDLVDDIKDQFPEARVYKRGPNHLAKKTCVNLRFTTKKAKRFVDYIYPHVRLKKEELDFYYECYNLGKSQGRKLSGTIKEQRRTLHKRYKAYRERMKG